MYCLTIQIETKPDKLREALELLRYTIEPTQAHNDCEVYYVCQDIQKRNSIWINEIWKSKQSFDRHLRSDEFRSILTAMELATTKPEIKMYTISSNEKMPPLESVFN